MEERKQLLSVPLSALAASPFNVRRHPNGQIEELAALIESQGLLHNLVVTEHVSNGRARRGGSKARFAVVAGERRRQALLLLQSRGRLAKDHEVPCELVPPERALEVSIAENSGREPLHPADEFDAFKAMIDGGKGVEDVAARFGVSALTVQRRLKLAALSPKLRALYRQDGIKLDQLMALALSDDHAAQESAWFGVPPWEQEPAAIRRRLTAGEVEAARSALARFVGIDNYEAAGGIVRRDLFDSERERYITDAALLERLANDKLEAIAVLVRDEGWGWVETRLEFPSYRLRQFTQADFDLRKPTAAERATLSELAKRGRELEKQDAELRRRDHGWSDEAEAIELEQEDIEARRRAIQLGLRSWAPEVKAVAGAIVTVNREGDAEVLRGLLRPDRRRVAVAEATANASIQHAGDAERREADDSACDAGGCAAAERPGFSEALTRRLAAHRTLALQVVLSRNTTVALAALAYSLALRVLGDAYVRTGPALQITAQPQSHALTSAADDLKTSPAWLAAQTARDGWLERLPADRSAWFGWMLELPQPDLLELLAFCASATVNALPSTGTASEANALVQAVGLDMAEWWKPTAEGFLNHISKAQIVQALREAGPDLVRDGVESMKKDVLVETALARLAGTRWLPAPLRPPPA